MRNTHTHTISGLLAKRSECLGEFQDIKARMATVSNDLAAIDRVLVALDYDGDLAAMEPPRARISIFCRNELRTLILQVLRDRNHPLSTRELAGLVAEAGGANASDPRLLAGIIKSVGHALKVLKARKIVSSFKNANRQLVWRLP